MLPDQGRFFLPKNLNHASPKDRLFAHLIDFVLLSVVSSFLIGALGGIGTYISIVAYHIYFIVAHKVYGFTVGKQAMGIFIANTESTSVTLKQIVLRETVWKWLSAVILMYGFLRLAVMGEALHDKMARTTVLTEKRKEVSFFKTAVVTMCMSLMFGSSVYYVVTQTAFVGHLAVKKLAEQGHIVRGLRGNPKSGWSIDYWKGETPHGTFELRGIRFIYDFTALYSVGNVHIKEIHVASAVMNMREMPRFLKKQNADEKQQAADAQEDGEGAVSRVARLLVDKVNLAKIRIARPGLDTIEVDQFSIVSLMIDRRDASVKQAYIDSSKIKLQIWDSNVHFASNTITLRSKFELRKGLHRAIIKPIVGSLKFEGEVYNPKLLDAEVFDGRLRLTYANNGLSVSARGLTPSLYVNYDNALRNITADLRNSVCSGYGCLTGGRAHGSFYHTNKKFLFRDQDVWAEGHEDDVMKLQLTSLWMNAISRSPIFSVATDYDIEDFVSILYYKKMYGDLAKAEKPRVDRIRKDFFKYSNRTLTSDTPKGAIPGIEDFNK